MHSKRLALSDVDLAGDQAEGGLYNLGNVLALAGRRWGAYVIDIRREGDATMIQHSQRNLKNNNEQKTGKEAALLDAVCRPKHCFLRPS